MRNDSISRLALFPEVFGFTSEQGDEGHQPMLLDHLVEFVVQVVVCVGFQGVFEQDPACHHQVMQPVGDVEDDSGCGHRGRRRGERVNVSAWDLEKSS